MKIMASGPITSWEIDGETVETVSNFIFWGSKITDSPLDSKEIKPVNPKGNQPWIFIGRTDAKAPIFGHLIQRANSLEKTLVLGKLEGKKKRGQQKRRWWHHWLNGHEFEQTPGVGEGQGSLACCRPWGCEVGRDLVPEHQLFTGVHVYRNNVHISP